MLSTVAVSLLQWKHSPLFLNYIHEHCYCDIYGELWRHKQCDFPYVTIISLIANVCPTIKEFIFLKERFPKGSSEFECINIKCIFPPMFALEICDVSFRLLWRQKCWSATSQAKIRVHACDCYTGSSINSKIPFW